MSCIQIRRARRSEEEEDCSQEWGALWLWVRTGEGWEAQLGETQICKAREGGVCSFIILAFLFIQTDTCQKAKKAWQMWGAIMTIPVWEMSDRSIILITSLPILSYQLWDQGQPSPSQPPLDQAGLCFKCGIEAEVKCDLEAEMWQWSSTGGLFGEGRIHWAMEGMW